MDNIITQYILLVNISNNFTKENFVDLSLILLLNFTQFHINLQYILDFLCFVIYYSNWIL